MKHFYSFFEGNQGADMTMLANKLNYDREVIRVWFCNKRQALKNTIKKFKQGGSGGLDDSGPLSPSDQMSPNQSQSNLNTSSQQQQSTPINQNSGSGVVNVVSSISQSLANVAAAAAAASSLSSSPATKTVITLNCNSAANNIASQQTTTLKIENTSHSLNGADQQESHNL